MVLRKWDSEDEAKQRKCIDEVIARVEDIDGSVGVVAAQDIIDIVTENLAPEIYNKGLRDAKKLIATKFSDVEAELDILEQS